MQVYVLNGLILVQRLYYSTDIFIIIQATAHHKSE